MSTSTSTYASLPQSNSHGTIRRKSASPYKITRCSPYKLATKSKSLLDQNSDPHPHPNPPPLPSNLSVTPGDAKAPHFEHYGNSFEPTTHVKLDFDLFQNGKQVVPTREQFEAIGALFPNSFAVGAMPPFLIVRCTTLPPKPWPVTVAGLPLFLTTDPNESPIDLGVRASGPKLVIDAEIELWKPLARETFIYIFEEYSKRAVKVEQVQWFGTFFKVLAVSEPFDDWKKQLPSFINNKHIGYVFGEEVRHPHKQALQKKLAQGGQHDDGVYSNLRPGVKIATALDAQYPGLAQNQYRQNEWTTTSGVCVQSPNGKKYITVASQGFPGGVGTQVMHPNIHGRRLGKITKVFGKTDISLCELEPGVPYSRETFTTEDAEIEIKPFQEFAATFEVGGQVFMDTPYGGRREGTLMGVMMQRQHSDDNLAQKTEYAMSTFEFFGIGMEVIAEGSCGGVIWDKNHKVLGQFRFQSSERNQLCCCPTFWPLIDAGYKLSEV